jgi:hypothetical protein
MINKFIINIYTIIFIFFASGCDQFSRFNYESFKCGYNSTGIQEILLGKVKKGSNLKLLTNQSSEQTKIEQVIGEIVYFNFQNKQFKIDRKNGNLIENDQSKVTLLKCEISKFKM